jgi:hypothetical protein
MNRRHPALLRLACTCAVVAALVVSARPLRAQSASAPTEALKTATSITDADRQSLTAWVKQQVADLGGADPAKRSAAKDALLAQANGPAGQPASPTYLDAYANALNTELTPLAASKELPTRLIAGIVAAQVAQKADNTQLLPVTLTLMGDPSEAVAYWGVRAAKYVLPAVLRNPLFQKNNKLQPAILATVKKHLGGPLGGPMADEGYKALTLQLLDTGKTDPNLRLVIGDMIELLRTRLELYKRATVPPEPLAERTPSSFLVHPTAVWPQATKEQRVAAMQAMSDLIGLASQHAQTTADTAQRDALTLLIQQMAKALWVAAGEIKGKAEPQALAIQKALELATTISPQTPVVEIQKRVDPIFPALQAHPELKGLTPPPAIAKKPIAAPAAAGAGQATTTRGSQ